MCAPAGKIPNTITPPKNTTIENASSELANLRLESAHHSPRTEANPVVPDETNDPFVCLSITDSASRISPECNTFRCRSKMQRAKSLYEGLLAYCKQPEADAKSTICDNLGIPQNIDSKLLKLDEDLNDIIYTRSKSPKNLDRVYEEISALENILQSCYIFQDLVHYRKFLDQIAPLYESALKYEDHIRSLTDKSMESVFSSDICAELTHLQDELNKISYQGKKSEDELKEINKTYNNIHALYSRLYDTESKLSLDMRHLLSQTKNALIKDLEPFAKFSNESEDFQKIFLYYKLNKHDNNLFFISDKLEEIKSDFKKLIEDLSSIDQSCIYKTDHEILKNHIGIVNDIKNQFNNKHKELTNYGLAIKKILKLHQTSCNLLNETDNLTEFPSIIKRDIIYLKILNKSSISLPPSDKYRDKIPEIKRAILSEEKELSSLYRQGNLSDDALKVAFIENKNKLTALQAEMRVDYLPYLNSLHTIFRKHQIEIDKPYLTKVKLLSEKEMRKFYYPGRDGHDSVGRAIEKIQLDQPTNCSPTRKDLQLQLFCANEIASEFAARLMDFKENMDIYYPETEGYYLSQMQAAKQARHKEPKIYEENNKTYNSFISFSNFFDDNQKKCNEASRQIESLTEEAQLLSSNEIGNAQVIDLYRKTCNIIQKQIKFIRELSDKTTNKLRKASDNNKLKLNYMHHDRHVALLNKKDIYLGEHYDLAQNDEAPLNVEQFTLPKIENATDESELNNILSIIDSCIEHERNNTSRECRRNFGTIPVEAVENRTDYSPNRRLKIKNEITDMYNKWRNYSDKYQNVEIKKKELQKLLDQLVGNGEVSREKKHQQCQKVL
ncbi:MAG: hypothetical protein C5B47_03625, partial [Verrucomicrobia bacterium]